MNCLIDIEMNYLQVVGYLRRHKISFEEIVVGRIPDEEGRMTLRGLVCADGVCYAEYGYHSAETNWRPIAKMAFYPDRESSKHHRLTVSES